MNMFHKIQILSASIQNPFLEIHPFTGVCVCVCVGGGGQHIPAGLPYPPTPHPRFWSTDCLQIMNDFLVLHYLNDENVLLSKHFLLIYNNKSPEMPWMTVWVGWWGGNLYQLVYLTPYP